MDLTSDFNVPILFSCSGDLGEALSYGWASPRGALLASKTA
jgi:hypothetical protein